MNRNRSFSCCPFCGTGGEAHAGEPDFLITRSLFLYRKTERVSGFRDMQLALPPSPPPFVRSRVRPAIYNPSFLSSSYSFLFFGGGFRSCKKLEEEENRHFVDCLRRSSSSTKLRAFILQTICDGGREKRKREASYSCQGAEIPKPFLPLLSRLTLLLSMERVLGMERLMISRYIFSQLVLEVKA